MHSSGINGEGESSGQLTNPAGSLGKTAAKPECMRACVCVCCRRCEKQRAELQTRRQLCIFSSYWVRVTIINLLFASFTCSVGNTVTTHSQWTDAQVIPLYYHFTAFTLLVGNACPCYFLEPHRKKMARVKWYIAKLDWVEVAEARLIFWQYWQ